VSCRIGWKSGVNTNGFFPREKLPSPDKRPDQPVNREARPVDGFPLKAAEFPETGSQIRLSAGMTSLEGAQYHLRQVSCRIRQVSGPEVRVEISLVYGFRNYCTDVLTGHILI
jgi:hypothetical protein